MSIPIKIHPNLNFSGFSRRNIITRCNEQHAAAVFPYFSVGYQYFIAPYGYKSSNSINDNALNIMLSIFYYFLIFVLVLSTIEIHSFQLGVAHFDKSLSRANGFKLFAHHVQKKTVQKIMDRRPKKKRLSDKVRRNVNLNKCITKFDANLEDYSVVPEEGKFEVYHDTGFSSCSHDWLLFCF